MFNSYSVKFFLAVIIVLGSILLESCGKNLPIEKRLNSSYSLVDKDSSRIVFPDDFKGNITVMGFIYTHCPDICPLTTNNMQMIQSRLKKDNIKSINFIELSFDPDRDTPAILKKYAGVREIKDNNFKFLTGDKKIIDPLLKTMNVYAVPGDTIKFESGGFSYSFIHTDRITLIDQQSRIRKEYKGSRINIDEIVNDIKSLM